MRVLHVMTRFGRGGSDHNLTHFMRWQLDEGHAVALAIGSGSDARQLPAWVRVHEVPELVRELRPLRDLRALRALARLARSEAADVVHTHQSKAGILGRMAARMVGALSVHTVHMASFGPGYGRASIPFLLAERACARHTAVIVTVGEELRERYLAKRIGRPEQYAVVRSPVPVDRFLEARSASPARRRQLRAARGLNAETPLLLSVGFIEARKRHDLLIEALCPLLSSGRAILAVAGEGPARERLEQLCARLDVTSAVHLLGHVEAVHELFAVADVLVHASKVEGVPQVVIQALAAGLPVVATETEGLREVPGAPVRRVDRDGRRLLKAVEETLTSPPAAIDPAFLDPWSTTAVERDIAVLHRRLQPKVRERRLRVRPRAGG